VRAKVPASADRDDESDDHTDGKQRFVGEHSPDGIERSVNNRTKAEH
jgi:hypothetical protein